MEDATVGMGDVVVRGDRADFDWQIEREIPHLRRYAYALTGDAAQADDLVQDCLERALRKWRLWRRRGPLRGWLFRMLYRVHLNRRRGRKLEYEAEVSELAAAPRQEDSQIPHVECRDMIEALGKLPDPQREALLLVALENLSYEEAAWVLHVPIGTLRSRLARGRESLRQICGDLNDINSPVRLRNLK